MPKQTYYNLSDEKKERIRKATYEMFINTNYEDVHIREIARKSDISIGSFYQYFYDKEDLYLHFFTEVEMKYMMKQKELDQDILFSDRIIPIEDVCTEEEVEFNETWYNVPMLVMQKFYFGEYSKKLHSFLGEELMEYKNANKLKEDLNLDFVFYLFTTSMFTIHNYFREHNITDFEERQKIKDHYFRDIFLNGILKK
ncbi:TetR/AcrR family transcriptional regulator [Lederbergia citrisecunda]|uniref:TetR/AcrR family transcriptional regulator n=1 Tax=Lederbergia citrisecunda TaxID=2833583 RepID=UPI003D2822DD